MPIANRCLFNFAASYSGGGYKRLYEYAKWFDAHGGAWFVIHPNCDSLRQEFPNNRFFVARISRLRRLLDDCSYLAGIRPEVGSPDLYYSYGIPVYFRFGRVNWFHLSNVMPLATGVIPLSLYDRLRTAALGRRIRHGLPNCDVISAESGYSLSLFDASGDPRLFLSVNGSDDELAYIGASGAERKESYAVVVGTHSHKAIRDSVRVFDWLQVSNPDLRLIIVGVTQTVPDDLRRRSDVVMRGVLPRPEVIACLRQARFYISTTLIENSYNAASEGIFIADESYISDIGPHRELLQGSPLERVEIPGLSRALLHIRRQGLSPCNLRTWDYVVSDMMSKFHQMMDGNEQ